MYLKLMIDGVTSSAFSASSMGPYQTPDKNFVAEIIESSRALYSHPRQEVEAHILKWTLGGEKGGKSESVNGNGNRGNVVNHNGNNGNGNGNGNRHNNGNGNKVENFQNHTNHSNSTPQRIYRDMPKDGNEKTREYTNVTRINDQRPETPRREVKQEFVNKPQQLHNPFQVAFEEIKKEVKEDVIPEVKNAVDIIRTEMNTEIDPIPETKNQENKKEIDEDTLKNVLGLKE
jgi:hypothetical protein